MAAHLANTDALAAASRLAGGSPVNGSEQRRPVQLPSQKSAHVSKIADDGAMDRPATARKPRWSRWLIAGALLSATGFFAWQRGGEVLARASSNMPTITASRLSIAKVERGPLRHELAVEARVVAGARPTIFAPNAGIVRLQVAEGQSVKAGDMLAVLDNPELYSRWAQEKAQLASLQANLDRRALVAKERRLERERSVALAKVRLETVKRQQSRVESLATQGLVNLEERETAQLNLQLAELEAEFLDRGGQVNLDIAEFEIDDARRQVERQRLAVDELARRVAELEIRAPFAGMIASLTVRDRDAVVQAQALLGLVDLANLELEIKIPEAFADEVAIGTPVEASIDNVAVAANVTRIAPEVSQGQVIARVAFREGKPPTLRQNQRVSTRVILGERNDVLHVPRGPFLQNGGGKLIYVQRGDHLERSELVTGFIGVAQVEILGGVEAGDAVILNDLSDFNGAPTIRVLP